MPGYGKVGNPPDRTSGATGEQAPYRKALEAIAADANVGVVIPVYASVSRADLERGAKFVAECGKPAAMLWVGGCTDEPDFTAKDLVRAGVSVFRDATPCMRA